MSAAGASAAGAGAPSGARPRLLFIRPSAETFPTYIATHFDEQASCLGQWFDVTVARPEGDYAELCGAHRPDLVMFESGVYMRGPRNLRNTDACPEIPKLGFLNSDAYCSTRRAFLSDMERWGVETFFTHSVAMAEHTPEIADRLFVWPNSINPEVYRDYGENKIIPVLLTGSRELHYPWRNEIMDLVSQKYPTLRTPHFGWMNRSKADRTVHGADYARLINAAFLAPTCGTIANEVVRKHFEIPGCRTCLLTESTPGLAAAGFVDMENCVFVDAGNVLQKLDYLFDHEDELRAITDRGHALVHERHTWANRDQIFQWFAAHQALRPGQRIVQLGPFGALTAVDGEGGAGNGHVSAAGPYRSLLAQAGDQCAAGAFARAEPLFLRCMNYHPTAPEPYLGLAICALNRGDADRARQWLERLIYELDDCQVADPDPVEWAYLLVTLLCLGKVGEASRRAGQYPALRHPELARARSAVAAIAGAAQAAPVVGGSADRASVHVLPARSEGAWFERLAAMLRACGQPRLADRLERSWRETQAVTSLRVAQPPSEAKPTLRGSRGPRRDSLVRRLRRHALRTLADPGYPARYLAARGRSSPFRTLIAKEASDSRLRAILLVSSRHWSANAHALLFGAARNPALPNLLRVGDARSLDIEEAASPALELPTPVPGGGLREAMRSGGVQRFDLVLIEGSAPRDFDEAVALADAGLVLIEGLHDPRNQLIARRLSQPQAGYELIASHPDESGGYAAFRRLATRDTAGEDDLATTPRSALA